MHEKLRKKELNRTQDASLNMWQPCLYVPMSCLYASLCVYVPVARAFMVRASCPQFSYRLLVLAVISRLIFYESKENVSMPMIIAEVPISNVSKVIT